MTAAEQVLRRIVAGAERLTAAEQAAGVSIRRRGPLVLGRLRLRFSPEPTVDLRWGSLGETSDEVLREWHCQRVCEDIFAPHIVARPRLHLRYLRQLQALAVWIESRCEGIERHRAEILRQQDRWKVLLDAETAVAGL